jgi:hypothetical protein
VGCIRRYVSVPVMQSLVTSMILTRLDHCNGVLFGLPAVRCRHLQAVQNTTTRLVFGIRRSEHIGDALISLQWLRVTELIRFKIVVLVYKSLYGSLPCYLTASAPCLSVSERSGLRSTALHRLFALRCRLSILSVPVAGANVWNDLTLDVYFNCV